MKILKLVLVLGLSAAMFYVGNNRIKLGKTNLPPILEFLNPFGGVWSNAECTSHYEDQRLTIDGLSATVEIIYDDRGVAHIFAQNTKDALFAQGYVEAQNRLWQMDFTARSGAGRLSEIVGKSTLNFDKRRRTLGIPLAARNAVKGWKSYEEYKMLEVYSAGINAWMEGLEEKDLPVEFKLLDYKPEKWDPYKSALITKSMAFILCARSNDVETSNLLNYLGREDFDFLFPELNPRQAPIIPNDKIWDFENDLSDPDSIAKSIDEPIYYKYFDKPDEGIGSNNWAISGQKSVSGNPILCNDPHLSLSLPSVWMEIHIHTPELNAYGVSIPGIPGIMSGFNEHIAWGVTNVGHDVLDFYKIDWTDESKTSYNIDNTVTEVSYEIEEIIVKGGPTVVDSIKYTFWGPIVYEDDEKRSDDLAMRWLAHDVPDRAELGTFVNLMRARDYNEYDSALSNFITPAQNFAFASRDGDIALIVNGKFPKKVTEEGRFVRAGDDSKYNWEEFIPRNELPRIKNPERAFVASANQHSAGKDYPHYYTGGFEDYRSRSIVGILNENDQIDVDFMKQMQFNSHNVMAEDILPTMLNMLAEQNELNKDETDLVNMMKDWNYSNVGKEKAPTFFELWFNKMYRSAWDEITEASDSLQLMFPESWRTIELILNDPLNPYFDLKETKDTLETAADLVSNSFKEAAEQFVEMENEGTAEWHYYKPVDIHHLLRIPQFSALGVKTDGHQNAINANKRTFGPSWRMIVELGDEMTAFGVFPGGQSGNPGSPFYSNMIDDWSQGRYQKIHFVKNSSSLSDEVLFTLKLEPQ